MWQKEAIYRIGGPLDLTFLMKVSGFEGFDHLRYSKYTPQPVKGMNTEEDIFTQIRREGYSPAPSVSDIYAGY